MNTSVGTGYPAWQLSRALTTATSHEDPATRKRAEKRVRQWAQVLEATMTHSIDYGSRQPIQDLPVWVTLKVVRGGFATGKAVADVPLGMDEVATATRLGIAPERGSLFAYYLSDEGLTEAQDLVASGEYKVEIPEDAALLTIAWLVHNGDRDAAWEVIDEVAPLADRLRFAPKKAPRSDVPIGLVYRITAGEARTALDSKRPNPRIETQREALTVWNPFTDRVLALWLENTDDGRVRADPDKAWLAKAVTILEEYEELAQDHTLCQKHRHPKQNLAILLSGLREFVERGLLEPKLRGLVEHAVASMVSKRGLPGSPEHAALREAQMVVAGMPAYDALAAIVANRLAEADPAAGITDPLAFAIPVRPSERIAFEGATIPVTIVKVLRRAWAAPIRELIDAGVVPSAEVLAQLVPQLSAVIVAGNFEDESLGHLQAATYLAFRRRRSLLLLDLEKQVGISELPWVRAVAAYRTENNNEALSTARLIGQLTLDSFPGVILPNPLIKELVHLLGEAHEDIPLVEELAADIFTGRFSEKFSRAAVLAGGLLRGSLYDRYYGIDYARLVARLTPISSASQVLFDDMCWKRSGQKGSWWGVAKNGTIIEQAQVLTTHNLAALVSFGVQPELGWETLAERAISITEASLNGANIRPRPLASIKKAAYAWRQAIFFLSMAPDQAKTIITTAREKSLTSPAMRRLLTDLDSCLDGASPRPFLGWTTTRHWILDDVEAG